jgi:menaquinone-specific isochorismate synthase
MTGTGSTQDQLHARTVPLDYGPDALQFDGSPTVLFDRPGLTLVGWGTAQLIEASEVTTTLAAIECDDQVNRTGSGVVALGALPFTDCMSGVMAIPRFTMGIATDPDGSVHRWATAVGPLDRPLPETEELFDAVIWQYGTTDESPKDVDVLEFSTVLDSAGYAQLVSRAVGTMQAPGATLEKVVLSRPLTATLSGPLPLSAILRRLRAHEPACTVFSMPVPDGIFFGASPELLVARRGRRVTAHPLAGTVARGTTARLDADAQGQLAASAKAQSEHHYVVEAIAAVLEPACTTLTVPSAPSLVAFRSVAHLGTRIDGELTEPAAPVLDLLARLHPTPAVGGTPRPEALAFIEAGEPTARGHWAGPVGWADGKGNGEWMIGIRSARLHPEGDTVTLQAGAGIVADSDPTAEATEVNVKLASVLEAVVPGSSTQLR